MKIIVGLGNIGKEYENTRHNTGFIFVDTLIKQLEKEASENIIQYHTEKKFDAEIAEAKIFGEKYVFVKPRTYMNASGKAVASIIQYYKAKDDDLIVAFDDVDLPIGTVRIRKEGSSGGHKGLQNIIDSIKYDKFIRIRIGIDNNFKQETKFETSEYVLEKFSKREMPVIKKTIDAIIEILISHLENNTQIPCHTYNIIGKEQKD